MSEYVVAKPTSWDQGEFLLYIEDADGIGKTVLRYGGNGEKTIRLSDVIGISQDKKVRISENGIEWESSFGFMASDGMRIIKKKYFNPIL